MIHSVLLLIGTQFAKPLLIPLEGATEVFARSDGGFTVTQYVRSTRPISRLILFGANNTQLAKKELDYDGRAIGIDAEDQTVFRSDDLTLRAIGLDDEVEASGFPDELRVEVRGKWSFSAGSSNGAVYRRSGIAYVVPDLLPYDIFALNGDDGRLAVLRTREHRGTIAVYGPGGKKRPIALRLQNGKPVTGGWPYCTARFVSRDDVVTMVMVGDSGFKAEDGNPFLYFLARISTRSGLVQLIDPRRTFNVHLPPQIYRTLDVLKDGRIVVADGDGLRVYP